MVFKCKIKALLKKLLHYCMRVQNCTKTLVYERSLLHEQTISHGDIFERVEYIFYFYFIIFLITLIFFLFRFFFTITVTPNPYPRSVTFFFLSFSFFLFPCKNDPRCKIVTRAKLTLGAKLSSCSLDPFPKKSLNNKTTLNHR